MTGPREAASDTDRLPWATAAPIIAAIAVGAWALVFWMAAVALLIAKAAGV